MNIVGELRCYLGKGYAQLKFSESRRSFSIDTVVVPAAFRNQGIGTMMINHIIYLADRLEKEINVSARPLGSFHEDKLQRLILYYKKFGFQVMDTGLTNAFMVRRVQK